MAVGGGGGGGVKNDLKRSDIIYSCPLTQRLCLHSYLLCNLALWYARLVSHMYALVWEDFFFNWSEKNVLNHNATTFFDHLIRDRLVCIIKMIEQDWKTLLFYIATTDLKKSRYSYFWYLTITSWWNVITDIF